MIVSICGNLRAARSQKAKKSHTATAPPPAPRPTHPFFLSSCHKPKGSGWSAEARTFRCETHRALAEARRARARAGVRADGGADRRHTGREPESSRGRSTSLLLALFEPLTSPIQTTENPIAPPLQHETNKKRWLDCDYKNY